MNTINTTGLVELLAALRAMSAEEREEVDFTDLPTFGGQEPADTVGVWAWDAESLLVGTCVADFEIVARPTFARDPSAWTIVDRRTDQAVAPAALFAAAEWLDENAEDYRADTLDGDRRIDDSDIHVYELTFDGCVAYVARGQCLREIVLADEPMAWRDVLADWDVGDSTHAELLASFGLDATSELDEADEEHAGACLVWIERNFYAGTLGNTQDGYYRDPESQSNERTVFENYEAAREWVDEREAKTYYLSHGEAGRPNYTICKA